MISYNTSSFMKDKIAFILLIFFIHCLHINSVNPFLPLWEYIPDGEPYIFEDPDNPGKYRVYIYGSHDSMKSEYCGRELVLWSASIDSLNNWRYDGIIFESKYDAKGGALNPYCIGDILYAPDIAEVLNKDGSKTYYLYPNNQAHGRQSMIAKSNRPDGPFEVCNWDSLSLQKTVGCLGFDPAVFVDDDGKVYGYWGYKESWGAELNPKTMATVMENTVPVKNLVTSLNQDGVFRFHEASSMRKIKDKYVFIYSRNTFVGEFGLPESNYTLAYAYSDNPLGPFIYGGTIIDCRGRDKDRNGNVIITATPNGNTHGSIIEINGQWYVFFHRQTGTNEFSRQAMVAPINVEVTEGKNGTVKISEAEFTSEGFEIYGLDPFKTYSAGIACYHIGSKPAIHNWPYMKFFGSYIKPAYYNVENKSDLYNISINSNPIVNNNNGSIVGYKYFNFKDINTKDKVSLEVNLKPLGVDGKIEVWIGSPWIENGGKELCTLYVNKDMPNKMVKLKAIIDNMECLKGKVPLFFKFQSENKNKSICEFYSLGFTKH